MKKSLFQRRPQRCQNIFLQTSKTECFLTVLWKESLNSLSWTHASRISFWEWFVVAFIRRYFHFSDWPQIAWNLHLEIPQTQCFNTTLSKRRFNSVSWIHTILRSYWEFFCLAFNEETRFKRRPHRGPNILLHTSQTQCFLTAVWKERLNSVSWTHTSQSSFSEWFCLVFIRRYFLF